MANLESHEFFELKFLVTLRTACTRMSAGSSEFNLETVSSSWTITKKIFKTKFKIMCETDMCTISYGGNTASFPGRTEFPLFCIILPQHEWVPDLSKKKSFTWCQPRPALIPQFDDLNLLLQDACKSAPPEDSHKKSLYSKLDVYYRLFGPLDVKRDLERSKIK